MKKLYIHVLWISFILLSSFSPGKLRIFHDDQVKIVQFYPNPATAYINFEFSHLPARQPHTLFIFSFIGKKMDEFSVDGTKITVSLDAYYRGLYVFQLRDRAGNIVESGKFQVVK